MGQKLVAKSGGWYLQEDGTSVQLGKKAIEAGNYEVVDSFDAPPTPAPDDLPLAEAPVITTEPDLSGLDAGNVPVETGVQVDQFEPLPGSQLPIGPFKDYVYAATPYGEFGIPAGFRIVAFREVLDHEGKRSYRALYDGKAVARTPAERLAWIAQVNAERAEKAEQGRI